MTPLQNNKSFLDSICSFDKDPFLPDEEYVSYDVESLFINVPVQETIDYILRNLCQRKITENMFQINHEAFITKINNRKHLHVELKLLQTN